MKAVSKLILFVLNQQQFPDQPPADPEKSKTGRCFLTSGFGYFLAPGAFRQTPARGRPILASREAMEKCGI
jgi:hypothetical protein